MKKFFHKIISFLHVLFLNLDVWVHVHIQPSIEVVQKIKQFLDGGIGDLITHLIPGELDDKIRDWIVTHLPKAIDVMEISAAISNEQDLTRKLRLLIAYLKKQSPIVRAGYYLNLASEMAKSSGKEDTVKGHSVNLLTQLQYSKMIENVTHEDLPHDKYCPTTEPVADKLADNLEAKQEPTETNLPTAETIVQDGHKTQWYI